jgi:hypothetical protein
MGLYNANVHNMHSGAFVHPGSGLGESSGFGADADHTARR